MLLKSFCLYPHLTDNSPASTATDDKEVKAWRLADNHVMAAICMSTDLCIRSCLEGHNTAKEMWDYLQSR
jgi:hypothetical protein